MKYCDSDLKVVGDIPKEYGKLIAEQEQFFYKQLSNNPELMSVVKKRIDNAVIINCTEKQNGELVRPAVYNGKMSKIKFSSGAGSFVTQAIQTLNDDGWTFTNGLYIRDGLFGEEQKKSCAEILPHEIFHIMSTNTDSKFDKNGICYTKSGFDVTKYDKGDKEVSDVKVKVLTEGVTEMLANMFNKTMDPHAYTYPTFIARILNCSKHEPRLLEAYVSEDYRKVDEFLRVFGEKQKTLTSKELVDLPLSENLWRNDQGLKTIQASLEFTISSLQSISELKEFYDYVKDITKGIAMKQHKDIGGKIRKVLVDALDKRKQEILQASNQPGERGM